LNEIVEDISSFIKSYIPVYPLNTDDIDPAGINIVIRDFDYEWYDDAVAVKPLNINSLYGTCTSNVLVENAVVKWGTGMAIGTVPSRTSKNCITDVTFRNVVTENPFKAIYVKTNPGDPDGEGNITTYCTRTLKALAPLIGPYTFVHSSKSNQMAKVPGASSTPMSLALHTRLCQSET
jgi:Glycosyl hydrolases family 28